MAKLTNIPPKEKQEKATPIHAFEGLQKLLRSMGYNVRTANGYKAMQTKDIGRDEIRNITVKDDGIYYKDDDGELRKIFMYKRKYHLEEYGKPRFHIRQCEVISDFMRRGSFNAEYRGANIETVKVIDTDNGNAETSVSELPLCKYCQGMAAAEFPRVITSKEFVEKLKEEGEAMEPQEDVEVDCGDGDSMVEGTKKLYERLISHGVSAELKIYEGCFHTNYLREMFPDYLKQNFPPEDKSEN